MDSLNNEINEPVAQNKGDKKLFIAGILIGVLVMGVVMIIVILIVTGRKAVTNVESEPVSPISDEEFVLDDTTVQKIRQIQNYIDEHSIYDTDRENLQASMLDGLLAGTGDKYSDYYTKEEIEAEMTGYSGKFYGIGVMFFKEADTYAVIDEVIPDSPAERAGFKADDNIVKVEGEDIGSLSSEELANIIRGEKGTKVLITVYRPSEDRYIDLEPIRDEVVDITVDGKMLEDGIGYIHISRWYDTTAEQFQEKYDSLIGEGMNKGLIIDLRSNGGGLVNAALDVLEICLPEGDVLYIENSKGERTLYNSYFPDEIDLPIVILTNSRTASASEIFTGAMRDRGRAVTIGTRTYGKGVVQSFYSLIDDSAIKLTTDQYFTPNGTAIDGVGIEPDVEVVFDGELYTGEEAIDNQLEEAVKYLGGKSKLD